MDDQQHNGDDGAFAVQTFVARLGFLPIEPRLPEWEERFWDRLGRNLEAMMATPEYEAIIARRQRDELTRMECHRECVALMGKLQREGRLPTPPPAPDPAAPPSAPET